ncbi:cell wall-associated NlpC family hydrolase [Desulfitobacterium sp. LBE]|uniref:NLP/P60 protein n=2 Tax=root TaxID=1 RepID=B8G005_DESHD|nr:MULTISPECIES: C40 family peptidase [Desulfitobacterium]ACL21066.1 NLP/P60 protein [Desulfitobacterium hafniense DCB-2]MEA5021874.1 C40 family peptidase [Desulfitobacterium hafniense]TWH56116.1 cell wall-associated NlpC family hydrolase [Desulfitobacterium sp. LBE]
MDSSSKRGWVASVVLSGTLLVSSLPGIYGPGSAAVPVTSSESILLRNASLFQTQQAQTQTVADTVLSPEVQAEKKDVIRQPEAAAMALAYASVSVAADTDSQRESQQFTEEAQEDIVSTPEETMAAMDIEKLSQERALRQAAAAPVQEISRGGSSKVEEISDNAQKLIGTPYVFGGTTTNGFDCSGFTQYVFKGSGIDLPRTSYAQYGIGTAVSKDELQIGDLVFFATYDSGASHVGIYIGEENFIHAARSGIKITGLSDSYYAGRYLGARRVF